MGMGFFEIPWSCFLCLRKTRTWREQPSNHWDVQSPPWHYSLAIICSSATHRGFSEFYFALNHLGLHGLPACMEDVCVFTIRQSSTMLWNTTMSSEVMFSATNAPFPHVGLAEQHQGPKDKFASEIHRRHLSFQELHCSFGVRFCHRCFERPSPLPS